MTINIDIPERKTMIPKITVLGVGGAGGNAVNNMINLELQGVNFIAANTDAQALIHSKAGTTLQLGDSTTQGLGAGSAPQVGSDAALESKDEILSQLSGSNMVFITAGMGGGTGTGAAPEIAKICKENGILTVGVVTKPFHFEGSYRMKTAEAGVAEMQKYVDTLIVIPNQNLFHKATEKTTFAEAFSMVDDILYSGIKGITDLMTMPGLINLDFADIRTIMGGMGKAMMGTGEAGGEKRALEAAEAAISNPLLDNASMKGAKGVLINISGGLDMTLFEADEAAQRVKDEVDPDANIIFGSTFDRELDNQIRVSVVATGIDISNNVGDRGNLFQRLENSFAPKAAETGKKNEQEVTARQNREEQGFSVEKAFIPPQAIDPQNLQKSESDSFAGSGNFAANIEESNVEPIVAKEEVSQESAPLFGQNEEAVLQSKIAVGEESSYGAGNISSGGGFQPSVVDNASASVSNIAGNIVEEEVEEVETEGKSDKQGKLSKSIGGILNFFTHGEEETGSKDEQGDVANDVVEDESDDLVVSDDILNVPTFLRNRDKEG